ncbi:hypothetical protein MTR_5g088767 [Medicago truncatula]|uniref:Transmembrane protein n=1 Tax=Medicago truncatula TaxID=3880 RepID=A0A072UR91_MEDTR|nr:hypothetical protein MTR_5g088767 [Medicago truncatula]
MALYILLVFVLCSSCWSPKHDASVDVKISTQAFVEVKPTGVSKLRDNEELVNEHSFAQLIIGLKKLQTSKLIRCIGDCYSMLGTVGKMNSGLKMNPIEIC